MKRLLLSFALALVAAAAFGAAADRDVLVTPDGTVYTVEQGIPSSSSGVAASNILELSVQNGSEAAQYTLVPESVLAGYHFGGTLAYDADSKTLFVLWTHTKSGMSSELLLASYRGRQVASRRLDRQSSKSHSHQPAPRHHPPRVTASEGWHVRRRAGAVASRSLVG